MIRHLQFEPVFLIVVKAPVRLGAGGPYFYTLENGGIVKITSP